MPPVWLYLYHYSLLSYIYHLLDLTRDRSFLADMTIYYDI